MASTNMTKKIELMIRIALDYVEKLDKNEASRFSSTMFLIKSKVPEYKHAAEVKLITKVFRGMPNNFGDRCILYDIADMPGDNLLLMKRALSYNYDEIPMLCLIEHACMNNNLLIADHILKTFTKEISEQLGHSCLYEVNVECGKRGYGNAANWYRNNVYMMNKKRDDEKRN